MTSIDKDRLRLPLPEGWTARRVALQGAPVVLLTAPDAPSLPVVLFGAQPMGDRDLSEALRQTAAAVIGPRTLQVTAEQPAPNAAGLPIAVRLILIPQDGGEQHLMMVAVIQIGDRVQAMTSSAAPQATLAPILQALGAALEQTTPAPPPARLGPLAVRPPADWLVAPASGGLVMVAPDGGASMIWRGPELHPRPPRGGPPLDALLRDRLAPGQPEFAGRDDLAPTRTRMHTGAISIRAARAPRRFDRMGSQSAGMHFLLQVDNRLYECEVAAGDLEALQAILEGPAAQALMGLRLTAAAMEIPPLTAERSVDRGSFALSLPEGWTASSEGPHRVALDVVRQTPDGPIAMKAIAQAAPGVSGDPTGALYERLWDELVPEALREAEGADRQIRLQRSEVWIQPGGAWGGTVVATVGAGAEHVHVAGACRSLGGLTLTIGLVLDHAQNPGDPAAQDDWPARHERAVAAFDAALEGALLPALLGAALRPPPARPEHTRALIEKGRFEHKRESSYLSHGISMFGGSSNFSAGGESVVRWAFHADGTCEIEDDSYFGFSGYDYGTGGGLAASSVGWSERENDTPRARFQVVGHSDDDLSIAVFGPDGLGRFHALDLDATGAPWGDSTPRGLAIDGRIEGWFYQNDDYAGWVPPDET